jgi:Na+-driven multidrug efflux pump
MLLHGEHVHAFEAAQLRIQRTKLSGSAGRGSKPQFLGLIAFGQQALTQSLRVLADNLPGNYPRVLLGYFGSALDTVAASTVETWIALGTTLVVSTLAYASTLCAGAVARHDEREAAAVARATLFLAVIAGLPFGLAAAVADSVASLLWSAPRAAEVSYLRCVLLSSPPLFFSSAAAAILASRPANNRRLLAFTVFSVATQGLVTYLATWVGNGSLAAVGMGRFLGCLAVATLAGIALVYGKKPHQLKGNMSWVQMRRLLLGGGLGNGLRVVGCVGALAFLYLQAKAQAGMIAGATLGSMLALYGFSLYPLVAGLANAFQVRVASGLSGKKHPDLCRLAFTGSLPLLLALAPFPAFCTCISAGDPADIRLCILGIMGYAIADTAWNLAIAYLLGRGQINGALMPTLGICAITVLTAYIMTRTSAGLAAFIILLLGFAFLQALANGWLCWRCQRADLRAGEAGS